MPAFRLACAWWFAAPAVVLSAALGGACLAQEPTAQAPAATSAQLSGTLAKVRASGTIAVGHRASSVPFSYLDANKQPIGYTVELCKQLVAAIGEAVHRPLDIRWVPVTAETRVDAVASGQVDLECGSTTSNLERRKRVDFSPVIFVAGTKVLVKKDSPIRDFRDLAGKAVAVTRGTTNEKAVRDLSQKFKLGIRILDADEQAQGLALVVRGEAEAFASDDVLLRGLIAQYAATSELEVLGDYLSYDPYGVMFRKSDPLLAQVVKDSFQAMAASGEIERQYTRWFLGKLPSGGSINLPMSAQLESIIQAMALKAQ
ncbi:MAG: amino acid ABC transporter substrate-binding protein [Proteobacteria bacterium]|nr:amino acid ABC transporter substrate-binding protein [Pseudomonadota bacterium]